MILLQIKEAVILVLLDIDEVKSVFDGDKNVILDNFSTAYISLSVFLAFSCLHKVFNTLRALSCTFNCVSWHAISNSLCGTLHVINFSENL